MALETLNVPIEAWQAVPGIEPPIPVSMTQCIDQLCASDFLSAQTGEQDRYAYAPVFTFNDANEIQLMDITYYH